MNIAIDVNRYVDFARGLREAIEVFAHAAAIHVPFIVLAELRVGFRVGSRNAQNERRLAQFMSRPGVGPLWPDEATTHIYADLFAHLRRAGTPIPLPDVWIASLCVQHGLPIYSRDAHFDRIPRLARI
ncbi:MAG: type II toxin-antitoxin system VapC family toxin [Phycisphaerae bacterium]